MGRNTFQKVLQFDSWPYEEFEVFIASNSLSEADIPKNIRSTVKLISGFSKVIYDQLKALRKKRVYVDGGLLLQSFIKEQLLNELILTRIPMLISSGIPLFSTSEKDVTLKHMKTENFSSRLTQSQYSF